MAYVFWRLFCAIEAQRALLLGPSDILLTPTREFFAIPALFAGLLLASVPLKLVLTRMLGVKGYEELVNYADSRQGINSALLMRHINYMAIPLIVVSVALALQTYAIANNRGLVIHPYFALRERSYGWSDVQRVVLVASFRAPDGTIHRDRQYFLLQMTDGFRLNFHRTLLEIPLSEQRRLAAFVAGHGNVQIETDDPYP